MLRYVYDHDREIGDFVAALIPHSGGGSFGPDARAIGVIDNDGLLIAGLVYNNYHPLSATIEMHGASLPGKQWLTRGTIAQMYQYPFAVCGCQMLYQKTPADDERLLRQLAVYDYEFIKVPRMFGRDRDGVLCTLTVEAWRANRFNKRLKHHEVLDAPQREAA